MKSIIIKILFVLHFLWLPLVFFPFFIISYIERRMVRPLNPDPKIYFGYNTGISLFIISYIEFCIYLGYLILIYSIIKYKKIILKSDLFYFLCISILLIHLVRYFNFLNILNWLYD